MSDSKSTEQLRYDPRNYGKSFKAWQVFIAASKRGESAVYRTPEGDICSPKRVEQLVAKRVEEACNFVIGSDDIQGTIGFLPDRVERRNQLRAEQRGRLATLNNQTKESK